MILKALQYCPQSRINIKTLFILVQMHMQKGFKRFGVYVKIVNKIKSIYFIGKESGHFTHTPSKVVLERNFECQCLCVFECLGLGESFSPGQSAHSSGLATRAEQGRSPCKVPRRRSRIVLPSSQLHGAGYRAGQKLSLLKSAGPMTGAGSYVLSSVRL